MKRIISLLTMTAIVLATSCVSSLKLVHDVDTSVDFTQFKTYYILPWDYSVSTRVSQFTQRRLHESIREEMNKRGFQYTENSGDLAVGVSILIEEMIEYTSSGTVNHQMGWGGMGWGAGAWGMGGWGMGHPGMMGPGMGMGTTWTGPTTITPNKFKNGTLILDVYDARQKTLIFQSLGSDRLNSDKQRERDRIPQYMRHLFAKFPIRPKK